MIGKEVRYNPFDLEKNWQRHVIGIGFILAAFYYNFSQFESRLGLKTGPFDMGILFFGAFAVVAYILNEWIVMISTNEFA